MPLMTRHASRRPPATDFPAGQGSQLSRRLKNAPRAWFAGALLLSCHLLPHNALAQQASVAPPASASAATPGEDPVARFLSDKGIIPSTRPVTEIAQQVRNTATDLASELVLSAMNFLGVPYRRGGNSEETGFDCSGFTRHVFENSVGLILPRRASEQARSPQLIPVPQQTELKPGDLVFFNTLRRTFSHVGIYIGDNKFIHSPRAGGHVRVEDMRQAYWQQRYNGARRAPSVAAQANPTPGGND